MYQGGGDLNGTLSGWLCKAGEREREMEREREEEEEEENKIDKRDTIQPAATRTDGLKRTLLHSFVIRSKKVVGGLTIREQIAANHSIGKKRENVKVSLARNRLLLLRAEFAKPFSYTVSTCVLLHSIEP